MLKHELQPFLELHSLQRSSQHATRAYHTRNLARCTQCTTAGEIFRICIMLKVTPAVISFPPFRRMTLLVQKWYNCLKSTTEQGTALQELPQTFSFTHSTCLTVSLVFSRKIFDFRQAPPITSPNLRRHKLQCGAEIPLSMLFMFSALVQTAVSGIHGTNPVPMRHSIPV